MFVIFGWGWRTTRLGAVPQTCPRCGSHAAGQRYKHVLKLSVFFVPLIPLRTRYTMECTACGLDRDVTASAAA